MMLMEENYQAEREAREKRIAEYSKRIQEYTLAHSRQIIDELVAERHRQNITQQEIANIIGIMPSNLARFESGSRVATLAVLPKYASALGKHIEIRICDNE